MAPFTHTATVRWSDCDANGHAANTAYSEYATDTRVAFLASRGWTFEHFVESRFGPVITREEIDYQRELRMGDEVTVDFTLLGTSRDLARFRFAHAFTRERDGKACARIVVTGGWMDLSLRRLATPPEALASIFRDFERGPGWAELPDAGSSRKG
jgi:acyl-CoA thioester hydrolase